MVFVVFTEQETKAGRFFEPGPSFATRAAAEKQAQEFRGPGGVRTEVREIADPSKIPARIMERPVKSERGLELKRRRERRELGQQAIEKVRKGLPISRAEREAARRLTGTNIQSVTETASLQRVLRGPTIEEQKQAALIERQKILTSRIRGTALTQRLQAQMPLPSQFRTISTGGVPLTILGEPRPLEFIKREPTVFETAQQRGFFESLKLIGGEGLNALTIAAEDIRSGFIGGIGDFGEGLFDRPIGKVKTGLFETTRDVSVLGTTLREDRKQITPDQDILFPVIPETLAKGVRGIESTLKFFAEDVPRGAKAAGSFVVSEEGREIIGETAKAAGKQLKERPGETLLAAGTITALGTFGIIKSTTGAFKQEPIFIGAELAAFGEVGRVGQITFKAVTGLVKKAKDVFILETPKTERFLDIDFTKGKVTFVKAVGKDITSTQLDLVELGTKGTRAFSKIITSDITQPTATIISTSLFGGLDVIPAIPLIFGRVSRGRAGRRLSKAELRKQSFQQGRQGVFVSRPQQEVGVRIRSPELKAIGVKERVIAKGPEGIRITDKGLAPARAGLTTIFGKTEKSLLEIGTITRKQRKTFSQAETLRQARQSGAAIDKVISTGQGVIVLQKSIAITRPFETIKRPKQRVRQPGLIQEIQPTQLDVLVKPITEKLPKAIKQQPQQLRGGFRPGTRERIFARIQQQETQIRLQQEAAGQQGALPGEFGLEGDIGQQISKAFAPRKKKRGVTIFEEQQFFRGLEPIIPGEIPAFSQLPSDIFTEAAGTLGPAARLRKRRLPPREDLRLGELTKQISLEQSLLGFDAGTRISSIFSSKLLGGLGLLGKQDIGLIQFQTQFPLTSQFVSSDVFQIPAIDTALGLGQIQAQAQAQDTFLDVPPIFDFPEPTPDIPRTTGGDGGFIDFPDPFVPDEPGPRRPGGEPFEDEPPPPPPPGRSRLFGLDDKNIFGFSSQGFDILIREKGQDVEFNKKKSFPRNRARNIGANIVDNSAAASFRIRKSKRPIDSGIDDNFFNLERKFRSPKTKSKLPPKQFIEKRTFRIDTAGELAGITAKGLIAKRKKAMKESFLGSFGAGISL